MIQKLKYVISNQTVPYLNLAMEEYLLHAVSPGECILYLWQNSRTVVIGRNQNAWKECRVSELEGDGGCLVRRLSGGGAVFHDLGNLNFTFLVREEDYDLERQLDVILRAVQKLGIQAEKSGRNDITVDGKKFSGNAFYKTNGHCYHHGTLLLHVDMPSLSKYLNVSLEKLQSKGVDSVKSRVTNLIEYCPDLTVSLMTEKLIEAFSEVYGLPAEKIGVLEMDDQKIWAFEKKFSSGDWKFGRNIAFTCELCRRFAWGDIQLQLKVDGGKVTDAAVFSDAMDASLVSEIPGALLGVRFSSEALAEALDQAASGDDAAEAIFRDIKSLITEQNI